MTYREKMLRHLREAEMKAALVDRQEAVALARAPKERASDLAGITDDRVRERMIEVYAIEDLKTNPFYRQNQNTRNYHISMANLYGLAALVEFMANDDAKSNGS